MNTILVTGGCGFIGSAFIRKYISLDNDYIVNVDSLTYASNKFNVPTSKKYLLIEEDIRNELAMKRIFNKFSPDLVVHFAAESHVTRSENSPNLFYDVNVNGTKNVLTRALSKKNIKTIHISTDEVYGPALDNEKFTETSPIGEGYASSPYSLSKAIGDQIAQYYLNKGKKVFILRPTNNFGYFQHPEKFLPRTIIKGMLRDKIKIWGSGGQIRDWLNVSDTIWAILAITRYTDYGIYNIAAENNPEISNLQIAKFVQAFFREDLIEIIKDPRPNHDQRYSVDSTKFRKLTGWATENPPWANINRTIKWYVKNKNWWKNSYLKSEQMYKEKELNFHKG